MKVIPAILICVLSSVAVARDVPNLGVMLNDDGDLLFLHNNPEASIRATKASMDAMRGTPIKTFMLSVGAGSDILHYDTKVASIYGWRETKWTKKFENPKNEEEMWHPRIVKERGAIEKGHDLIRVSGEYAREMGLRFFPSFRMNDDHFVFDPHEYPLTGEFWDNNQDLIIGLERSPILSQKMYGNLLDFSHAKVREHRLAVVREVIDRYHDISEGIELDFNRTQIFFPRGKAGERAHLLTAMVAEVRRYLDEAGKKNGRDYYLVVRVPPTLKNCHWAGMEVEKWIEQRLVDAVCPSQLMTLAHDMPVDEFVKLAKPVGCKVYPYLYPRTSYHWDFTREPTAEAYAGRAQREVTPILVRGAAQNYWHQAADGFGLFNFHHEDMAVRPFSDRLYRILRDLDGPKALTIADKVFAITPAYYLDHEDTYQYRKQVPVALKSGQPVKLTLMVGEDLSSPLAKDVPPYVALRLGFNTVPEDAKVEVMLNGRAPVGPFGRDSTIQAKGATPTGSPIVFAQLRLDDHSIVKQGVNEITVTLHGGSEAEVKLAEVHLGVIYDRQYLDLLYK
ncbi:MAG TPA: hypothetical protein VGR35_16330 [Tepidisphaeraceae bacterium]|nr:hypothetical protein [Tepidisphaeraceae bacterium]